MNPVRPLVVGNTSTWRETPVDTAPVFQAEEDLV
jgi:hypothetical protein